MTDLHLPPLLGNPGLGFLLAADHLLLPVLGLGAALLLALRSHLPIRLGLLPVILKYIKNYKYNFVLFVLYLTIINARFLNP